MVEEEKPDIKDQETSDWTLVEKLNNLSKVKPYDIEVLATSKVPHNIPYLEVYRTDELYYEPYVSPYLSVGVDGTVSTSGLDGGVGDQSSGDGSDTNLWTELSKVVWEFYPASKDKNRWIQEFRDADATWASIARVVNKMGGDKDKQNKVIGKVLEIKKKYSSLKGMSSAKNNPIFEKTLNTKKLHDELVKKIAPYYKKSANLSTIANKYVVIVNTKETIAIATGLYAKHLKKDANIKQLNSDVAKLKKKYS